MEAIIKLRGKHIVSGGQLTLLDNTQASTGCSAGSTYSEYSGVTQIIITPQGSNSIGGADSKWKIEGSITIDGTMYDLSIGAPMPVPSVEPALPTAVESTLEGTEVAMSNVAESVADVTSCKVFITIRDTGHVGNFELVGRGDDDYLSANYTLKSALHESDGAIVFSIVNKTGVGSDITRIVIVSESAGSHTFE